jgi:hypothetical protein
LTHPAEHSANHSARWAWFGRLLALSLLLVAGAGQTLPGLHHLLVRHAVCAEHGELVHAAELAEASSEAGSESDAARPSHDEPEHEHEHCSMPGLSADPALVSAGPAAERQPLGALPASLPAASERAHSSLALLAFAPKLAPPV